MNFGILVLALLISQAALAEFTSEDNCISYGYCTVGCDAYPCRWTAAIYALDTTVPAS